MGWQGAPELNCVGGGSREGCGLARSTLVVMVVAKAVTEGMYMKYLSGRRRRCGVPQQRAGTGMVCMAAAVAKLSESAGTETAH